MVRSAAPSRSAGKPALADDNKAKANPQSVSPNELPADPKVKGEQSKDSPQPKGEKKPV